MVSYKGVPIDFASSASRVPTLHHFVRDHPAPAMSQDSPYPISSSLPWCLEALQALERDLVSTPSPTRRYTCLTPGLCTSELPSSPPESPYTPYAGHVPLPVSEGKPCPFYPASSLSPCRISPHLPREDDSPFFAHTPPRIIPHFPSAPIPIPRHHTLLAIPGSRLPFCGTQTVKIPPEEAPACHHGPHFSESYD